MAIGVWAGRSKRPKPQPPPTRGISLTVHGGKGEMGGCRWVRGRPLTAPLPLDTHTKNTTHKNGNSVLFLPTFPSFPPTPSPCLYLPLLSLSPLSFSLPSTSPLSLLPLFPDTSSPQSCQPDLCSSESVKNAKETWKFFFAGRFITSYAFISPLSFYFLYS